MSRPFNARRATRRALSFSVALVAASFVAACDDNVFTSPASQDNVTRTYSVFAVTGTSNTLPAAYQYSTETLVRPQVQSNGSLNFDVAFDIGTDGKVRIMPARYFVPLPPAGAPTIGLQKMTGGFDALSRAPVNGYTPDSAVTAGVGDTYTLELRDTGCIYGEFFYGKLTVDSIILAERRIVLRSLVNRNCGYRSLTLGLPKD